MPQTSETPLSLGQWLELSWQRYKDRLWEQLTIGGLGSAAGLAAALLPAALPAFWWSLRGGVPIAVWIAAGLLSVSGVLWTMGWAQAAMAESALAPEKLGWRRAFSLSWPKVAAFSWVCILWFLVLCGGLFFFVVPAIVLGVSLAFAPLACVAESKAGFSALEASFSRVRGRWWSVLGRLALVGLALSAAAAVPWVGWILSALAAPFALIAAAALYEDLRRIAGPEGSPWPLRAWLLACAGGLLILAGIGAGAARAIASLDRGSLAAAARTLMQRPLDQEKAQELAQILQGGATPETLSQALAVIQSSQPVSAASEPRP